MNLDVAPGGVPVEGTPGDDTLPGTALDERFEADGGNDLIEGGGGTDAAVFGPHAAGYRFGRDPAGYITVTDTNPLDGDTGTDRLRDVERLVFGDGELALRAGGEFRASTETADYQYNSAVAALPDGGFVLAWASYGQDGSRYGVFAQRYDAAGVAQGPEQAVNTTTFAEQSAPSIGVLADGRYVISWQSFGQDASSFAIAARLFAADGTPLGEDFLVNTFTDYEQELPAVAGLEGGGFVVTWQSWHEPLERGDIYARLYADDGTPHSVEFRVASSLGHAQSAPVIAALHGGGFVVVWESLHQDGDLGGIFAQRFDADGQAQGDEFRVNDTRTDHQTLASVAALRDGGFVATWASLRQDGSGWGVFAQRFDAEGATAGPEFRANTHTRDDQVFPSVGALADGGFVLSWQSWGQDGSGNGIYAQRYDADGMALGREFRASSTRFDLQDQPALAGLADGGFVVSWSSHGQDGDGYGIYAQRFDARGLALRAELLGTAAGDLLDLSAPGALRARGQAGADTLLGGGGDSLHGGQGPDTYHVAGPGDVVVEHAREGMDTVHSAVGWTLGVHLEVLVLEGEAAVNGAGNALPNTLTGNPGANCLDGREGSDRLYGKGGDDTLVGGAGGDTLSGGAGADAFVFDGALAERPDRVTDFGPRADRLWLDDDVFTAFDAALSTALGAAQFHAGPGAASAQDADDRIIYDTASGALYYDADGIGGQAGPVLFAVLGSGSHPRLDATAFLIVG